MAIKHLKVTGRGPCPEFPHEHSDELRNVGDHDTRVILRERFGFRERRTFILRWDTATEGQAWELKTLFQSVGTVRAMNYVPPNETAIVEVRFTEPVSITRRSAMHHEMQAEVTEVLR